MTNESSLLGFFKNPLVTLVLAVVLVLGNWWRNADRLDIVENGLATKQDSKQADERNQQVIERLKRIEDKLDRLTEKK